MYIGFIGEDAALGANDADWTATTAEAFEESIKQQGDNLVARLGVGRPNSNTNDRSRNTDATSTSTKATGDNQETKTAMASQPTNDTPAYTDIDSIPYSPAVPRGIKSLPGGPANITSYPSGPGPEIPPRSTEYHNSHDKTNTGATGPESICTTSSINTDNESILYSSTVPTDIKSLPGGPANITSYPSSPGPEIPPTSTKKHDSHSKTNLSSQATPIGTSTNTINLPKTTSGKSQSPVRGASGQSQPPTPGVSGPSQPSAPSASCSGSVNIE